MPRIAETCPTAASTIASASALDPAEVAREASSPPRAESPSREPSRTCAVVALAQPSPSCHTSRTRSPTNVGFTPAPPSTLRRRSRIASVSTGPKAL